MSARAFAAASFAIAVLGAAGAAAWWTYGRLVAVPSVIGMKEELAARALRAAELEPGQSIPHVADETPGTVLGQSPPAGARAAPGTRVHMTVAAAIVRAPRVIGMQIDAARRALLDAGYQIARTDERETDQAAPGTVLEQQPPGGTPRGPDDSTDAQLIIAAAPPPPSGAAGTPAESAAVHTPAKREPAPATAKAPVVAAAPSASPAVSPPRIAVPPPAPLQGPPVVADAPPAPPPTAPPPLPVAVPPPALIPAPPAEVTVPNVKGMRIKEAEAVLALNGLKVGVSTYEETETWPSGTVMEQRPVGGSSVTPDRLVDLVVARAAAAEPSRTPSPLPIVGDTWRYRYTSDWGGPARGTFVHEVLAVTSDGIRESMRIEGAAATDVKSFGHKLQIAVRKLGTVSFEEFAPYLLAFDRVGPGWRQTGIPPPATSFVASGWTIAATFVAEESLSVPAGRFRAARIDVKGSLSGAPQTAAQHVVRFEHRIWYAPAVKRIVKYERDSYSQSNVPFDRDRYELLSYTLK